MGLAGLKFKAGMSIMLVDDGGIRAVRSLCLLVLPWVRVYAGDPASDPWNGHAPTGFSVTSSMAAAISDLRCEEALSLNRFGPSRQMRWRRS